MKSSKTTQTQQLEEVENNIEIPAGNLETNKSLEKLVRENSWYLCEICKFKSISKKDLRINTVKSRSVGSIENNYKVLVYHGGGLEKTINLNT